MINPRNEYTYPLNDQNQQKNANALCSQRASPQDKKSYAGTFDLNKRLKLVQLPTLSKKTYGFTCVIANPKPLFAP